MCLPAEIWNGYLPNTSHKAPADHKSQVLPIQQTCYFLASKEDCFFNSIYPSAYEANIIGKEIQIIPSSIPTPSRSYSTFLLAKVKLKNNEKGPCIGSFCVWIISVFIHTVDTLQYENKFIILFLKKAQFTNTQKSVFETMKHLLDKKYYKQNLKLIIWGRGNYAHHLL